jgi:NTP pyrophosphatase (non-canonical NTP hydrolase)
MTLNEYQARAEATAFYRNRTCDPLQYVTIALVGEAGEFANEVKKHMRSGDGVIDKDRRVRMILELGDVLWYLAAAASELDVNLGVVARLNLEKLALRAKKGGFEGTTT